MAADDRNPLGIYLKDRRTRLDPSAFGLPAARRRTPGLRREEVAQRAAISPTWYTWLEQGRGGPPSPDVLDRIAAALAMTETEREHLFLLGVGHPPGVRYRPTGPIEPRLQRVLDALDASPAIVSTATWDIVAWNEAAAAVLTDYATLRPEERNVLRLLFLNPKARDAQHDWERVARYVVAVFRAEAARLGAAAVAAPLIEEMCDASPDFVRFWREQDVAAPGAGVKRLHHPVLGALELEYTHFSVDGRPDLGMIVYNAVDPSDVERIRSLVATRRARGGA